MDIAALHSFVFGEIGLMPGEYYMLLIHELNSMIEGYNRRQNNFSNQLRISTYLQLLPHTKDLSFEMFCRNYWPLPGDRREKIEEIYFDPQPDREVWEALKKQMPGKEERREKKGDRREEYERILQSHKLTAKG